MTDGNRGYDRTMKQLIFGTLLLATAIGAPLEQGERDRAMSHLHATRKVFLDSVAGLSEAQWNFKPAPQRWSIAECAEHIAVSDDSLFELIRQMMKSPAAPEKKAEARGKDEMILKMLPDRSVKATAPEFLQPKRRWPNQPDLIAHFKQSRDRNIAYIQTTEDDMRSHFRDHPMLKTIDAYQMMLLLSAHCERHTLQINEVKADPNYPK
jgi:DinB superfamily